MEQKYSRKLMLSAVDFMRAVREECGSEFTDDHVNAMFEAFDPALKNQIFIEMLLGNIGQVKIRRDYSIREVKKIAVIKAVRKISGFGLKESKDIVDAAEQAGPQHIVGSYTLDELKELRLGLIDTGYEIV